MRVQAVRLKHFKQFEDRTLDFTDPNTGAPRDLVVLVGPNGSGKSTVLQSIAATVGTATGRLRSPYDLQSWPGFDLDLAGRSWPIAPLVEVDVMFDADELATIADLHARLDPERFKIAPGQDSQVKLTLANGRVMAPDQGRYFQFLGRRYAKILKNHLDEGHGVFERVGTIFWYTEQRTANSLTLRFETNDQSPQAEATLDEVRTALAHSELFHLKHPEPDQLLPRHRAKYRILDDLYRTVFPGRHLDGSEPRNEPGDMIGRYWFFLRNGSQRYELVEMSGAERAIFPLLFDVANWSMHRSVVLIDELELHLHPPIQQAMLRALPKLGQGNQFIISTHSEAVADLVPESAIVRL